MRWTRRWCVSDTAAGTKSGPPATSKSQCPRAKSLRSGWSLCTWNTAGGCRSRFWRRWRQTFWKWPRGRQRRIQAMKAKTVIAASWTIWRWGDSAQNLRSWSIWTAAILWRWLRRRGRFFWRTCFSCLRILSWFALCLSGASFCLFLLYFLIFE